MSITDCHLSIQTFWRCKYSVLRPPLGYTDSLSNESQFKWTVYGYLPEEEGKKEKEIQSQERKYSMKNKQKSLGWGWRVARRKRDSVPRSIVSLKYSVRQLESQYMFLVKNAYIM